MNPRVYSTTRQAERILETLLVIEKGVSFFTLNGGGCKLDTQTDGLCYLFENNVRDHLGHLYKEGLIGGIKNQFQNYLRDACVELGVYSGSELFPILANKKASYVPLLDARDAFVNKDLWSRFTRYGRTRRQVLKKMIELVAKDLKALKKDCEVYTEYKKSKPF